MERKEYNGWTNYETWAVKLWLDNDEGSYLFMREQSAEMLEKHTGDSPADIDADGFKQEFSAWLKDYHEEQAEEFMPGTASVFHDLLNAALSEVDWYEIAGAYLDDAKEAAAS